MTKMICIIAVTLTVATSSTWATSIGLFADVGGENPFIDDVSGIVSIYVVVTSSAVPLSSVEFSAPVPDCFPGATWVSDTPVMPITIGDSQTGVAISWGGCLPTPIHVLTINVQAQALTDWCCLYRVLPHPTTGNAAAVDCNSNLIEDVGAHGVVSTRHLWVGEPDPPDGAAAQPLNTLLGWGVNSCGWYVGIGTFGDELYFGTSPDPPLVAGAGASYTIPQPYDPGPLAAATTYYWKVKRYDPDAAVIGGVVESPVWQFTTEGTVPVDKSTWGRIKALYRK